MTPIVESFFENGPPTTGKDPRWLQAEVCREFQRGKCTRSAAECRFAHPDETVQVDSVGKVTACFDSMKGRCQRESCKYFHPPHHIKLQLQANGRLLKQHKQQLEALASHHMIQTPQQLQALASHHMIQTPQQLQALASHHMIQTPQQLQALASQHMIQTPATVPILPMNALGTGAFPLTFLSTPIVTNTTTSVRPATTNSNWRTEKVLPFLEVCQDYIKGMCSLTECSAAHPDMDILRDRDQKRITVCMDYVKGRCTRELCRYFHPPTHLQGKLKTVKITQSLISTSSRKRLGEAKDDLEERAKQQALNYTLINTPLTLPANYTFVQPSGFQPTTNAMQFAPAFFSTLPLSQFTTTTATTPYIHPQLQPHAQPQLSRLSNTADYKHLQIPICRDYKSGNCKRETCRYIHLDDRNVEVIDWKVTVCLDDRKGKCERTECKYYHCTKTSDNRKSLSAASKASL